MAIEKNVLLEMFHHTLEELLGLTGNSMDAELNRDFLTRYMAMQADNLDTADKTQLIESLMKAKNPNEIADILQEKLEQSSTPDFFYQWYLHRYAFILDELTNQLERVEKLEKFAIRQQKGIDKVSALKQRILKAQTLATYHEWNAVALLMSTT